MDKKNRIGKYKKGSTGGEYCLSYIPAMLPPNPPIQMDELYLLLDLANSALGRLEGISSILPDPVIFAYMYNRREALVSSQIEGTQSSFSDLLLFEDLQITTSSPSIQSDTSEVLCYIEAMVYGLDRIKTLPLSLRLIREIHQKLMAKASGNIQPGEFRTSQNWIGGPHLSNAFFVPPPPEDLMRCLDNFEKFLHDEEVKLPTLILAAIAHVQFETIHPFLDGNGRIGRLLITLILCVSGILKEPMLYISLYLKEHRDDYYNHLQSVRKTGDWEAWIKFFLIGVSTTANQAIETAQDIINLFAADRKKIEACDKFNTSILSVFAFLQKHPIVNTTMVKDNCSISLPTTLRALSALQELGIVKEFTGRKRHMLFIYKNYMDILSKGTEPLAKSLYR